jgi:hypothetical protein
METVLECHLGLVRAGTGRLCQNRQSYRTLYQEMQRCKHFRADIYSQPSDEYSVMLCMISRTHKYKLPLMGDACVKLVCGQPRCLKMAPLCCQRIVCFSNEEKVVVSFY